MDIPVVASAPAAGRVLVVDDEKALAGMVASCLARAGYTVVQAHTGPGALAAARTERLDVVVLDLGLPGLDGIEVCRRVRASSECYVLMLTARGARRTSSPAWRSAPTTTSRSPSASGNWWPACRRSCGARAPGRPWRGPGHRSCSGTSRSTSPAVRCGWPECRWPSRAPSSTSWPPWRRAPHEALSRRRLIDVVWDPAGVGDEHIVDVHIGHLRRKIGDDPARPRWVDTVRGIGYRMASP